MRVRSCLVIAWYHDRIHFGRKTRLDIGLTRSDLPPFARIVLTDALGVPATGSVRKKRKRKRKKCLFLQTCLGAPTWNRLVQKKKWWKKNVFFLRKRLTVIGLFEGPWLVGTRFRG